MGLPLVCEMTIAIDLNYELQARAIEINNEMIYWSLPQDPKFEGSQISIPNLFLRMGHAFAEFFSSRS
jgi:hypothetical protein